MYPTNLKDIKNVAVRSRIAIERRIVSSLVHEFGEQGFTFLIDDGDNSEYIPANSESSALDALMNTDEDQLGIVDPKVSKIRPIGWIKLTYGNDGWDVMSDWHTNLDQYMPKTLALVEELS